MLRKMLALCLLIAAGSLAFPAAARMQNHQKADGIVGRWDLTVQGTDGSFPSWLEVTRDGDKLTGRFTGRVGNARPVPHVEFAAGQLTFSLPPQYEKQTKDLVFKGRLTGNKLEGTTESEDGKPIKWTGVRAPELKAPASPKWGQPIQLFNGRDLRGWRLRNSSHGNCWSVAEGAMSNNPPCTDIITEQKFKDFKLHLEFKIYDKGAKGNSGVYLRGRYEAQILDASAPDPPERKMGSIYGFITPTANAAKEPGEWQTYDITLLGRWVTIVLNGQTIVDNQEIPGLTGGALDSDEGAPGPILLQGDHGKVSFRNVTLTPAK